MKRISIPVLRNLSLVAICLFLSLGLAIRREWILALIPLVVVVLGWLLVRIGFLPKVNVSFGTIVFLSAIIGAGAGSLTGLPAWTMLLVVLFAITYWDLDALMQRIKNSERSVELQMVEQEHLRRLVLAVSIGFAASLPGLFLNVKISLFWAIVLGLVIIFGARLLIKELSQQKEIPD